MTMTNHEYSFLRSKWEGERGPEYNETYNYCRNYGWCVGLSPEGTPILTDLGIKAIKSFKPPEEG